MHPARLEVTCQHLQDDGCSSQQRLRATAGSEAQTCSGALAAVVCTLAAALIAPTATRTSAALLAAPDSSAARLQPGAASLTSKCACAGGLARKFGSYDGAASCDCMHGSLLVLACTCEEEQRSLLSVCLVGAQALPPESQAAVVSHHAKAVRACLSLSCCAGGRPGQPAVRAGALPPRGSLQPAGHPVLPHPPEHAALPPASPPPAGGGLPAQLQRPGPGTPCLRGWSFHLQPPASMPCNPQGLQQFQSVSSACDTSDCSGFGLQCSEWQLCSETL